MGVVLTRAERKLMLLTAVAYMRSITERRGIYEEECKRDARNGHRPHYCIHGANMWVDHDIPCGTCEAGYTDRDTALGLAHDAVRAYIIRLRLYGDFHDATRRAGQSTHDLSDALAAWMDEPLHILHTHPRPTRNLP